MRDRYNLNLLPGMSEDGVEYGKATSLGMEERRLGLGTGISLELVADTGVQLLDKTMKQYYSSTDYLDKVWGFFNEDDLTASVISDHYSNNEFSFVSAAPGGKTCSVNRRKEVWLSLWLCPVYFSS